MRSVANILIVLSVVLAMLSSCRTISRFLRDDEIVAEAGDAVLYRSDLEEVIPLDVHGEDSTRLATQYINSWASDQVFMMIAEKQLSKSEKDVTKELEAYRKALLKYRYEQLYVNERLDTSVSPDMIRKYYEENTSKFILESPVVKARYLNISAKSPMKDKLKKMMSSSESEDIIEADSLAYSSAMKFLTWRGDWLDISLLSAEFGLDNASFLSRKKGDWVEYTDSTGMMSIAYIEQIKNTGEIAPMEYCTPLIKDLIVGKRKQEMIFSLEQNLLKDARERGHFKTY